MQRANVCCFTSFAHINDSDSQAWVSAFDDVKVTDDIPQQLKNIQYGFRDPHQNLVPVIDQAVQDERNVTIFLNHIETESMSIDLNDNDINQHPIFKLSLMISNANSIQIDTFQMYAHNESNENEKDPDFIDYTGSEQMKQLLQSELVNNINAFNNRIKLVMKASNSDITIYFTNKILVLSQYVIINTTIDNMCVNT